MMEYWPFRRSEDVVQMIKFVGKFMLNRWFGRCEGWMVRRSCLKMGYVIRRCERRNLADTATD